MARPFPCKHHRKYDMKTELKEWVRGLHDITADELWSLCTYSAALPLEVLQYMLDHQIELVED